MDCRMNVGIAWQAGDGEQVALHARKVATPAAIKKSSLGARARRAFFLECRTRPGYNVGRAKRSLAAGCMAALRAGAMAWAVRGALTSRPRQPNELAGKLMASVFGVNNMLIFRDFTFLSAGASRVQKNPVKSGCLGRGLCSVPSSALLPGFLRRSFPETITQHLENTEYLEVTV